MNKDRYFAQMRQTSEDVFPYIMKYLDQIKDIDIELYSLLMFVTEKRRHKPMVRPFLVRLAYEVCGGENWQRIIPACAAFELLNISSYQSNCAFDNKMNILSKSQKDSQFIASVITREICSEMVMDLRLEFGPEIVEEIERSLNISNKYIYIAQHYDLNLLTVNNYVKYIADELFMKDYIKRCYYGGGVFTSQAAYAGGLLANADKSQLKALYGFGENYGIGLQIMNDLADFIPAGVDEVVNRNYQDQFSDIRNGRLTLGVYKLLKNADIDTKWILGKVLNQKTFSDTDLYEIARIVAETDIANFAESLSGQYGKKTKQCLGVFSNNDARGYLGLMASVCYSNKYLKCFTKIANKGKTKKAVGS